MIKSQKMTAIVPKAADFLDSDFGANSSSSFNQLSINLPFLFNLLISQQLIRCDKVVMVVFDVLVSHFPSLLTLYSPSQLQFE